MNNICENCKITKALHIHMDLKAADVPNYPELGLACIIACEDCMWKMISELKIVVNKYFPQINKH